MLPGHFQTGFDDKNGYQLPLRRLKKRMEAVMTQEGQKTVLRDYWLDATPHIKVLEAYALKQALAALAPRLHNTRVDVWLDSQAVIASWQKQGGRNSDLNDVFKVSSAVRGKTISISP